MKHLRLLDFVAWGPAFVETFAEERLLKPTAHEAAARLIERKPAMEKAAFDKLLPQLKARAFTVSGIEGAHTLQSIRESIAKLPRGGDWNELKGEIVSEALPYFVDPDAEPEVQDRQREAAERRAELLLRTHGFAAYQAVQYEAMDRHRDALPYWMYMTVGDENVREEHAALDGVVLPADSPFWASHFPPWDWGCRCQAVAMTQGEYERTAEGDGYGRTLGTQEQRLLEESGLLQVGNGRMVNVLPDARKGAPNAFASRAQDLRIPAEDVRKRMDPDVFAAFEDWARKTRIEELNTTVWEWANAGAPGANA